MDDMKYLRDDKYLEWNLGNFSLHRIFVSASLSAYCSHEKSLCQKTPSLVTVMDLQIFFLLFLLKHLYYDDNDILT